MEKITSVEEGLGCHPLINGQASYVSDLFFFKDNGRIYLLDGWTEYKKGWCGGFKELNNPSCVLFQSSRFPTFDALKCHLLGAALLKDLHRGSASEILRMAID